MADGARPQPLQQRTLLIRRGDTEVEFLVPIDLWASADVIRQSFADASTTAPIPPLEQARELREMELTASFLQYSMNFTTADLSVQRLPVVWFVLLQFRGLYVRQNDIHAVTRGMAQQGAIIQTYLAASALTAGAGLVEADGAPKPRRSALLSAVKKGRASIVALFGGQGNVDAYFDELAETCDVYGSAVGPFLGRMVGAIQRHLADPEAAATGFYSKGFDVSKWLAVPESRPPIDYLVSAPISMPLIALAQLLNYWVMVVCLRYTLQEVRERIKGVTGHSQGLISALAVACSTDEATFMDNCERVIGILFWMGLRSQQAYLPTTLNPKVLQDSLAAGEGEPTPMLAIHQLPHNVVREQVKATNRHLPADRQIHVSLLNGPRSVIVSGAPQSLYGLNVTLRKLKAKSSGDQSRIPFSKRNAKFSTRFLPVSVPFHSEYLAAVPDKVMRDLHKRGLVFTADQLLMPVFATDDGRDLAEERAGGSESLTESVVRLVCCKHVDWPKATACEATHMIDFGPGGSSGIGNLTNRNKQGTGVQIILGGTLQSRQPLLDASHLYDTAPSSVCYAPNWAEEFAPRLVRTAHDNRLHVDTLFSRVLGRPTVMVAGMTPTSVHDEFVSAVMNAGYHCELAGGGHYTEDALRRRVDKIMTQTGEGEGITLNVLFLNARQWGFQYPLAIKMRNEGLPIDGLCIAAGVPSLDNANEIVSNLSQAGIRHVAFKPGSTESIRQVVAIAEANPSVYIMLQWTGGRAGGHHSFEDMFSPILETYGLIRKQKNIILVAGSGFGDGAESLPFLVGDWSRDFGYAAMPFDAILIGSRMMVAREARTSPGAKALIVAAPGASDQALWEQSYDRPVGGVVTVKSELGEPIHKIATRGVMLWKELDDTLFNLPRPQQLAFLREHRAYLIRRLNADFQKVWFCEKGSEGTPCELSDMTYFEVARRLVKLCFVAHQKRWIDASFKKLLTDYLTRVEERFVGEKENGKKVSVLEREDIASCLKDEPDNLVSLFFESFPDGKTQTLNTQDVLHFLHLCSRRGQKPVPFIPVLNEEFSTWFKKDSLWQSEDLDAVIDGDAQRVCILQGPVAARYSTTATQSAKEILDSIYDNHVAALLERYYGGDRERVPLVTNQGGYTGATALPLALPDQEGAIPGVVLNTALTSAFARTYDVTEQAKELPDAAAWLCFLGGKQPHTWLHALLNSPFVVRGNHLVRSPLLLLFRPRPGQRVVVSSSMLPASSKSSQSVATSIRIYDAHALGGQTYDGSDAASPVVEAFLGTDDVITVNVYVAREEASERALPLPLLFAFRPLKGASPLHEITDGKNERIKAFYFRLWFGEQELRFAADASNDQAITPMDKEFVAEHVVTREAITAFCRSVGNQAELYVESDNKRLKAPMDYAIVASWKAVIGGLFPREINGDLLHLVHLSNEFRVLDPSDPLISEGDCLLTRAHIQAIINDAQGKTVTVKAVIYRRGSFPSAEGAPGSTSDDESESREQAMMHVISSFYYRRTASDPPDAYHHTFRRVEEVPYRLHLRSAADVAVLKSKPWVAWRDAVDAHALVVAGAKLDFKCTSVELFKDAKRFASIETTGTISTETAAKETIIVGSVSFVTGECVSNPVTAYLSRAGTPMDRDINFPDGGANILPESAAFSTQFAAPANNAVYAKASRDLNPIHTNPYFADLADLPSTITHGMWTSAATRRLVEVFAADNDPKRVSFFRASFVAMVQPGDTLQTKMYHVGMRAGKKIIKVETFNADGVKVLDATAEVDQAVTAYIFTGQGSQEKNMGMDLYASSDVARRIWDLADAHFKQNYGFSILHIVRNNPTQVTVHFGGPRGDRIRRSYMAMTYELVQPDGSLITLPLFPTITADSDCYTFKSPGGLLNATQFTQPALTLLQKSQFEDMKHRGLLQQNRPFAGHSLGEYAALASIGNVLPIESLVDVVFYRGMTMQSAVRRDDKGRSEYGMTAVNPSRVGQGFGQIPLQFVIDCIIEMSSQTLLEIVNYNVEHWQYVVAGTLLNLETLTRVLNFIRAKKINVEHLIKSMTRQQVEAQLRDIVSTQRSTIIEETISSAKSRGKAGAYDNLNAEDEQLAAAALEAVSRDVVLTRGEATIPLTGIDVPFHSRFLRSGVAPFRAYLLKRIEPRNVDVTLLVGKYIPNVIAEPFSLDRSYVQRVWEITGSPKLARILRHWDADRSMSESTDELSVPLSPLTPGATQANMFAAEQQQQLGYTLLVELLAYQFASPVRWIETQDQLFKNFAIERLIEIGPGPTLVNMAQRTLKFKYEAYDDAVTFRRENLAYTSHKARIYYEEADPVPQVVSTAAPTAPAAGKAKAAAAPAPSGAPQTIAAMSPTAALPPPPPPAAPSAVSDAPLTARELVHVIVAYKTRKPLASLPMTQTLKDVSAGKSALTNELVGDLQKEFGDVSSIEKADELPLSDLAEAVASRGGWRTQGALGAHTSSLVAKLIGAKMPAGMGPTQLKSLIASAYGLGPQRTDGLLLHALTREPASRFGSEGDVKSWLDAVAQSYAAYAGITLGAAAPQGGMPQGAPVAVAPAPSANAVGPVADEPVTAIQFVRALIAAKLKKPYAEIAPSTSLKTLSAGKSTLTNELLGDIQKEFGDTGGATSDTLSEAPLTELASASGAAYAKLGAHSLAMLARLTSAKMPAGMTVPSLRGHLSTRWGLGPGRQDACLLHALTMEPPARLGNEQEAHAWLDGVVAGYAAENKVPLGGAGGGGGASQPMQLSPALDASILARLQARQDHLLRAQLEMFASHIGLDLLEGERRSQALSSLSQAQMAELDGWRSEHGDTYAAGIAGQFDTRKARRYDSWWNWSTQEALQLYYALVHGHMAVVDRAVMQRSIDLMGRAHPALVETFDYYMRHCGAVAAELKQKPGFEETAALYERANSLGTMLALSLKEAVETVPRFKDLGIPRAPQTEITSDGQIIYREVERKDVRNLSTYVKEMRKGVFAAGAAGRSNGGNAKEAMRAAKRLRRLIRMQKDGSRTAVRMTKLLETVSHAVDTTRKQKAVPFLHLKSHAEESGWTFDQTKTNVYFEALEQIARDGISFANKTVLLTGSGRGSIGADLLRSFLAGGARVIATTSSFSASTTDYYRAMYERHGARSSSLVVVPFNQASTADVQALADYIYSTSADGLGWDIDFIVPFAAIGENGREMTEIDDKSEVAHRMMLTNVLRLVGAITSHKRRLSIDTRPALLLLPLSPNHGLFGGDGLYSESKIGLETLLYKWHSESWSAYVSIVGAVIGWTRGTGLMAPNNIVAEGLENSGAGGHVRTFSSHDMAFNLIGLLHTSVVRMAAELGPVWADLNGGLERVQDLNQVMKNIRDEIKETAMIRSAIARETQQDQSALSGSSASPAVVTARANIQMPFPELKPYSALESLGVYRDLVDLDRVIVVTGYGEVGPWGNSRTRWEMEAHGQFSLEGCIEMAWLMGFIRHNNGPLKSQRGAHYAGWVDSQTEMPIQDMEVKAKYEEKILKHSGIRLIEPALFDGYDPDRKQFLQQVVLDADLPPLEVSHDEAKHFKHFHGDQVDIYPTSAANADATWTVRFRKGATLYVPKALRFDRLVAGQIPTGWDAKRYGIPDDIVNQVDPVTLYVLVATAEALMTAGISDPYEFYKYVHVSEVGNCSGGGVGGMRANTRIYRERFLDRPVQSDILQENFINTMPAWVNMLLLSSSGPIKPPVGACATSVLSVEIGIDTILSGKARIVVVGGYDDFQEEGSYEFAQMRATSNARAELERGREPREMSRPATTTRDGFMEAQGAGMQVLMPASLAIEMGVPIYGILAMTATATDKSGRSVPAPGRGILTVARESKADSDSLASPAARVAGGAPLPFVRAPSLGLSSSTFGDGPGGAHAAELLMSVEYRARQVKLQIQRIDDWVDAEKRHLERQIANMMEASDDEKNEFARARLRDIEHQAALELATSRRLWGTDFYRQDARISPLRGALNVFNLTIDDIGVASLHGTSTQANDINETAVLDAQLSHLGRSRGNTMPAITQKYLTGHPKGAAAAWMLNGVLQVLGSGIIPGNRNADNIDERLRDYEFICFPSRAIKTDGIKAAMLTSFGFGQVGGQVLVIHPDYALACLSEDQYLAYCDKRGQRNRDAFRHLHDGITQTAPIVRIKDEAPYDKKDVESVYLDPLARATRDPTTQKWTIKPHAAKASSSSAGGTKRAASEAVRARSASSTDGSGVVSSGNSGAPKGLLLKAPSAQHLFKSLKPDSPGISDQFSFEDEHLALTRSASALPSSNLADGVAKGIGVDIELLSAVNVDNDTFVSRNFTDAEVAYCLAQPDPRASFAGRWCAKEATLKAISNKYPDRGSLWDGAGAPLRDIEVVMAASGAPTIVFHGKAAQVVGSLGVADVKLSISHSGAYAMAMAAVV